MRFSRRCVAVLAITLAAAVVATALLTTAEYADVVLNRRSDAANVRPVIFPH